MQNSRFGICVCGLNGSGKTTLAGVLAKKLNYIHMDVESYYFVSSGNPYASSRTREEVEKLLLDDIKRNPRFVFSAVSGNIIPEMYYDLVIYLDAPLDVRIKRIRNRAYNKFGNRVLSGGDMYEQEEAFFEFARKRTPDHITDWLKTVACRVIHLDGTKPIEENIRNIIAEINASNETPI